MPISSLPAKRSRGRPRARLDLETTSLIKRAANDRFRECGYSATSMSAVAGAAGISTKTLYRLYPTKVHLFTVIVSDRMARLLEELEREPVASTNLIEDLAHVLYTYSALALSDDATLINRLVIAEPERFSAAAATFYREAVKRNNDVVENWLRSKCSEGLLVIDDPHGTGGMLRGMMVLEPQTAMLLRETRQFPPEPMKRRATACATLFLRGCGVAT